MQSHDTGHQISVLSKPSNEYKIKNNFPRADSRDRASHWRQEPYKENTRKFYQGMSNP